MTARALAVAALLAVPTIAAAALDVPVVGKRLALRAETTPTVRRRADLVFRDAAIAAPFADPTVGSVLIVAAGAGPGACHVEIALPASGWRPIKGDGTARGWRYHDPSAATAGIRRIDVRRGRVAVEARGPGWPCDLAAAQTLPVAAELRFGSVRWCSTFGGTLRANAPGRFTARDAAAPASCPKADVTVADLNILHGLFCPPATANCRRADRIDLLYEWVARRGCPDVVTLQEVWDQSVPLLQAGAAAVACPFTYTVVYQSVNTVDDAMLLSRWPVLAHDVLRLYKNFRHVLWTRIDHPIGPVDVFTTHLASGSDGANAACGADCPPECVAAGAATVRQCQGVQLGAYVTARHDVATPAVVTGDLNQDPTSFVYQHLIGLGWVDSYLAAGNAECVPATGAGCTSGRDDVTLTQMESPASNETERIDYAFVVPPAAGSICRATLDPATDPDGDGTATRLFADLPNPADPSCGPTPAAICWSSDHVGAELDLDCF